VRNDGVVTHAQNERKPDTASSSCKKKRKNGGGAKGVGVGKKEKRRIKREVSRCGQYGRVASSLVQEKERSRSVRKGHKGE